MTQSMMPPVGGPYLQAALFCDVVIQGNDGVLSLIRVVDRVQRRAAGPGAPAEMQPFVHRMYGVVMLKAGQVRGSHRLEMWMTTPARDMRQIGGLDVYLEGEEDRGANAILTLELEFREPGLYWFDVKFDGQILAKMPFRVVYLRN